MAKKGVKFNKAGFEALRQDYRGREDLVRRAELVAREASRGEVDGYIVTDLVLEDPRAAASVMATGRAHFHNRKHLALIRALAAGKG